MKVKEYNPDFKTILLEAEAFANTEWDMEFIANLWDKYDAYGENMYVSEKQIEQLERIARL